MGGHPGQDEVEYNGFLLPLDSCYFIIVEHTGTEESSRGLLSFIISAPTHIKKDQVFFRGIMSGVTLGNADSNTSPVPAASAVIFQRIHQDNASNPLSLGFIDKNDSSLPDEIKNAIENKLDEYNVLSTIFAKG